MARHDERIDLAAAYNRNRRMVVVSSKRRKLARAKSRGRRQKRFNDARGTWRLAVLIVVNINGSGKAEQTE